MAVPFDTGTDSPTDSPTRQFPTSGVGGGNGVDPNEDSSLLNPNRKPRSTILVTVRLANPPPSDGSYGSRRRPLYDDTGTDDEGGTILGTGSRSPPPSNASYGTRPPNIPTRPRRPLYGDPDLRRSPYRDTGPDDAGGTTALGTRSPNDPPDPVIGVGGAFAAMQLRKLAHRPRVSSPLVASVLTSGDDPDQMELDPWDVSPLSSPPGPWSPLYVGGDAIHPRGPPFSPGPGARRYSKRPKGGGGGGGSKKGNKAKNGGRVGMLRWAVLNHSGPEVGRRILAMGPKLAKEIWEAERVVEEMDAVGPDQMEVVGDYGIQSHVEAPDDGGTLVIENHKHGSDVEAPDDGGTIVIEQSPDDTGTTVLENRKHGSDIEAPDDGGTMVLEHRKHGTDVEVSDDGGTIFLEQPPGSDAEEHRAREKLAEECIRELEEMEVDSEDIEMEASSASSTMEASTLTPPTLGATTTATTTTTEKATETPKIENNNNNNNRMDLDMPAAPPAAVVTPLSTARQVQIQLEIAVELFSPAKKAQKDAEKSKRWFERIAL